MFLIASKMILCLLIALLLGIAIGYLLCKMCKDCEDKKDEQDSCCQTFTSEVKSTESTESVESTESADGKPLAVKREDVTPDNLKKIKGVGVKIETALNELGVYTFEQISKWDDKNIAWVDEYLVFKGRIDRDDWVIQAKLLASGKETEFSKKVTK